VALTITSVRLEAYNPSTGERGTSITAFPGDTITFYITVVFDRPPTSEEASRYYVESLIYINGGFVGSHTGYFDVGQQTVTYSFTWRFTEPGTYTVYVDSQLRARPGVIPY